MADAKRGKIYVVATPIGNLEDISPRALRTLGEVDVIAAEDTRHTANLCRHFNIDSKFVSLHGYNENERVAGLLHRVGQGESVAVVSDAGTPLISDPGYLLVKAAREQHLEVIPIPGPCAFVAALSVAGLPASRLVFEGFLPARKSARVACLERLKTETGTMIFYESPHRIRDFLNDIDLLFTDRLVVVARELTKSFETILSGTAAEIMQKMNEDANQLKGEFVVMVEGSTAPRQDESVLDADALLGLLIDEMPISKAAGIVAKVSRYSKKQLYEKALLIKENNRS
jgi:16S rRNA (cytidine1402-2'-O)-methyltransferase